MADDSMSTSKWIKFFTEAGLPDSVAVNAAIIFSENRIQKDMLMDLTKEYLFDMGINVMGDVIAILKHAKHVRNLEAQEKAIETTQATSQRKSPAARMLEHYTRRNSNRSVQSAVESRGTTFKRKFDEVPSTSKQFRITMGTSDNTDQGSLKVRMPSGNTLRTRQILEKQGFSQTTQNLSKRSVFERLGAEGTVSSSTDPVTMKSVFGRLGPSVEELDEPYYQVQQEEPPLQYQGIFKTPSGGSSVRKVIRLSKEPARSTTVTGSALRRATQQQNQQQQFKRQVTSHKSVVSPGKQLKPIRVTLTNSPSRLLLKKALSGSVASSRGSSEGIFGSRASFKNQSVKNRLGSKPSENGRGEKSQMSLYTQTKSKLLKITTSASGNTVRTTGLVTSKRLMKGPVGGTRTVQDTKARKSTVFSRLGI